MNKITKKIIIGLFALGFMVSTGHLAFGASSPSATTLPATSITDTTAVLNATINSNGIIPTDSAGLACFEIASFTTCTSNVPFTASASSQSISYTVTGLTPGHIYSYRVQAANNAGLNGIGAYQTFTTTTGGGSTTPTITSLSPSSGTQGSSYTVAIYGTNFTSGMTANFGSGITSSTTYNSSTQLTANITISSSATVGTNAVTVSGVSGSLSFSILASGSGSGCPSSISASPSTITVGSGNTTVTIYGNNFTSSSMAMWNGSSRPTTYQNSSTLLMTLYSSDLSYATNGSVTVSTSGCGNSNSTTITINTNGGYGTCPTIYSISPSTITNTNSYPYSSGYTYNNTLITIYGSNFMYGSTAMWNGSSRSTSYISPSQLTMNLYSSDLSYSGTITVTNSNGYGCGNSNGMTLYVNSQNNNSTPTVVTLSSSVNGVTTTMNGSVNANGTPVTTWFKYGTNSSYLSTETLHINQGSGTYSTNFNAIVDLSPNTTYYYQAVANNPYSGNINGSILSFTTSASTTQPSVTTTIATNKTMTGARLNGIVSIQYGMQTQAYFEYGTTANLGNTTTSQNLGNSGTLNFSDSISNLSPNTEYYFRAVAVNQNGISYGSKFLFNTLSDGSITPPTPQGPQTNSTQSNILKITTNDLKVNVGDAVEYFVTFKNDTQKNFDNTIVNVQLPNSVTFDKSNFGTLNASNNTVVFDAGTLIGGQNGSMTIKGHISNKASGQVMVTATMTFNVAGSDRGEISYVTTTVENDSTNLTGAALFGNWDWLPHTLLGWLIFLLVIFGIIILVRKLMADHQYSKVDTGNDDPHGHH